MPEIDDELLARAIRWCGDAGRHATSGELRAALGPLSWDELLAARALLADPPPGKPIGPLGLADLARGAPVDAVVERERAGQYGEPDEPARVAPRTEVRRESSKTRRKSASGPVVRRARDRLPPGATPAPRRASLDELFASEGRAVLNRLIREQGARRGPITESLAAHWQRPDGSSPDERDLERLLDAHGLTRGFERRERDELLHALRAAGGVTARASRAVGLSPDSFEEALVRLRARVEASTIRDGHRDDLRRRVTLSERARLLLSESDRLSDLGLLEEFEADLRMRLPEHLRALRASTAAPIPLALARSLSIGLPDVQALSDRLNLDLRERAPAPARDVDSRVRRSAQPFRGNPARPPRSADGASRAARPVRRPAGRPKRR